MKPQILLESFLQEYTLAGVLSNLNPLIIVLRTSSIEKRLETSIDSLLQSTYPRHTLERKADKKRQIYYYLTNKSCCYG